MDRAIRRLWGSGDVRCLLNDRVCGAGTGASAPPRFLCSFPRFLLVSSSFPLLCRPPGEGVEQPPPGATFRSTGANGMMGALLLPLGSQSGPTLCARWTAARQAPLCTGLSRQESWSRLPSPSPGDLPDPGIKPGFPALQADSLPLRHHESPNVSTLSMN